MRLTSNTLVAAFAGLAAATFSFVSVAGAQDAPMEIATLQSAETAVFAGGCFWCVEADFDKVDGVVDTLSGYTGGISDKPTYRTHKLGGHLEAVKVTYDPAIVSYDALVSHFFRHVDPTDAGGQFCDRGKSYATAIFVDDADQRATAEAIKAGIEQSGVLPGAVVTPVEDLTTFWPAEGFHQDYYLENPIQYRFYRKNCGRDQRIERIWSGADS